MSLNFTDCLPSVLEFGVKWCAFRIQSELFEFGVSFLNSEWSFRIRSELFEFGVSF